jgi:transcriptional regulator with XRE-family HTH domain
VSRSTPRKTVKPPRLRRGSKPLVLGKALAKAIRDLREEQGITQETLAEDSDLSVNFISELERGIKSPSLGSLEMLCHGFEVPLSDLIRRAEKLTRE